METVYREVVILLKAYTFLSKLAVLVWGLVFQRHRAFLRWLGSRQYFHAMFDIAIGDEASSENASFEAIVVDTNI